MKGHAGVKPSESKSCCKQPGHEHEEIVFACYECSDTYCYKCLEDHRGHHLIYFKDGYIVANYDQVAKISNTKSTDEASNSQQSNQQAQNTAQAKPVTS